MRRFLPLVLALGALAAAPSAVAEDVAPPAADAVQGVSATTSARANVRYGPNTNARIVCTLDAGEPVEIIGPAEVPDWYVVRFPQKGQAWIDAKNLKPIDNGKRWEVVTDGTRARDDATLKGNIVTELAKGEVVEDRNSARGTWHAVYIPSAVAYVSKKVLNLPDAQAIQQQREKAQKADALWSAAQSDYSKIWHQVHENPDSAVAVDWEPLQQQLEEVAKTHPDSSTRQSARRILDGIAAVAEKSKALREARGKTGAGGTTGGTGAVASNTTGGTTGGQSVGPVTKIDLGEKPLQVPEGGAEQPKTPPIKPAIPAPAAAPATFTAVGFVSENSDYPKVGAPNLLLDGNSNVVAFLQPKAGAALNLAEYYWRWIGVSGEQKELDPALHGLGKKIPLIEVDAVQLLKK